MSVADLRSEKLVAENGDSSGTQTKVNVRSRYQQTSSEN
jgi:hypothetical protein